MSWKDIIKNDYSERFPLTSGERGIDLPREYILADVDEDDILYIEIFDDRYYERAKPSEDNTKFISLGNINSKSVEEFQKEIDRINVHNLHVEYLDYFDLESLIDSNKSLGDI